MQLISSKRTFFYKKIFPFLWLGFLALFIAIGTLFPHCKNGAACPPMLPFFIIPAVMMVFGAYLFRLLIHGLVDEVWDYGDYLLVKSDGREYRVGLVNIINVSLASMGNPPRITLTLRDPCPLGKKVAFIPQVKFSLAPGALWNNKTADDLVERADRARRQ